MKDLWIEVNYVFNPIKDYLNFVDLQVIEIQRNDLILKHLFVFLIVLIKIY